MMNKKTYLYAIVFFLVMLLLTLPARTALSLIPASNNFSIAGASGSIWSGHAASIQVNRQTLMDVNWGINPIWLLTGKLGGSVSVNDPGVTINGGWKVGLGNTLYLDDMQIRLPAKKVVPLLPMKGVALEGDFRIDIEHLSFNQQQGPQDVDATLYWLKSAASIAGPIVKLGNFTLTAKSQEDGRIELLVKPGKNKLDAQGSAIVTWPNSIALDISVTENVPDQLKSTVAFLKKADNNRRTLKMTLPLNRNARR